MAQFTATLRCVECRRETGRFERGWRAYLTDEEHKPAKVVVLCPACSEREFGEHHGRRG